jgi:hypothetical protein
MNHGLFNFFFPKGTGSFQVSTTSSLPKKREGNHHKKEREERIFYLYFLFILQNYATVSKFISFDHQTPWRMAATVGHGGWGLTAVAHRRRQVAAHAAVVGHDGWFFF